MPVGYGQLPVGVPAFRHGRTTEAPLLARGQGRAKGGVSLKSTGTLCGHCDAPVSDGYLCSTGVHDLREALAELTDTVRRSDREPITVVVIHKDGTTTDTIAPGSFGRRAADPWSIPSGQTVNLPGELNLATARMVRFTSGMGITRRDDERPMPLNLRSAARQRDLRRTVAHWAAVLLAAGRTPPLLWTTSCLAAWMERQLPWIRLQEWSVKMLDDIRDANDRALRVVDRPADRLYLGVCGQPLQIGRCQSELIAAPGDSLVRCTGCGTSVGVSQRRSELMDIALGLWMTAGEIERLSTALTGERKVKRATVLTWHRRGQLMGDRPYCPKSDDTDLPQARFLLREVLAMAERPQRGKRRVAA